MKKSIAIFVSLCLLASAMLVTVSPIQAATPGDDKILVAPLVVATNPADFDTGVAIDAGVSVLFDQQMDNAVIPTITQTSGVPTATFTFSTWATATFTDDTAIFTHDGGTDWNELQAVTLQVMGGQNLAAEAYAEDLSWSFITEDNTNPEITMTTPANTNQGVALAADIVVTFSEPMDTPTVTYTCTPDPTGWSVAWTVGDTVATYSHTTAFAESTAYTFEITAGDDLAGNPLAAGAVANPWTFTTVDLTNPEITVTSPVNVDTGVTLAADIVVTFSEAMDTPTVTYTCTPDPTGWSVAWTVGNTVATYSHTTAFAESTTYTFEITAGNDLYSNPLAAGAVANPWTFTTVDLTGPQITATTFIDTQTDVPTAAGMYEATWSEAMAAAGSVTTNLPGATFSWPSTSVYRITYTALAESTLYTITYTGFTDAASNAATGDLVKTFTTGDTTAPVVTNLTLDPANFISVNNPIHVDFQVYEADLDGAGVTFAKSAGGNATLDNYTGTFDLYSDAADLDQNLSNPIEYNVSKTWNTICPADLANSTIHGYLSNDSATREYNQYVDAGYWENATNVEFLGTNVYFTNETYPDGEPAELQFLAADGSAFGLNIPGPAEWLNATNILNGTYHDNATIQLRISIFCINATGVLVASDVEIPYGRVIDLVDVHFIVDQVAPSGNYWTVAYGGDTSDNSGFNMSNVFTVDNILPTIVLDSPADSALINNKTLIALTVTDVNLALVTYSTNGTAVNLTAPYDIVTTDWADGVVAVVVVATDNANNEATVTYTFTLDSTVPAITLVSPDDGSRIMPGTILDYTVLDAHLANVTYSVGTGAPQDFIAPYEIDTAGWADGTYTITVWANDTAGNEAEEEYTFIVDGTAPIVISTVPANGAVNVPLSTTIVITFNESMNNASVRSAITITPTIAQANLNFTWNALNTVLTIRPLANLTQTTVYTVTVGATAKDVTGNNMTAAYSMSFTTLTPEVVVTTTTIVIGPVLDPDGNPIVGATVTVTIGGITYTGTTDANGNAYIVVPTTALGSPMTVSIAADGYETLTYDTTLNLDGTIANAPPAMTPEAEGTDYTMIIIIVIVIVIIIAALALMMRKPAAQMAPAKEEAEPATEEETPAEEEAPAEEETESLEQAAEETKTPEA